MLILPLVVADSAWVLAQLGEAGEATSRLREGEELLERYAAGGHVSNVAWACYPLGRACLLLGRLDEAQRLGDRALASSPRHPGFAAHARHLLGDIATHPDRFDAESGEAHYRKALALAEPRGMRPLVAHCHLGLGTLYAKIGPAEQARAELSAAIALYRAMDMTFWLPQARRRWRRWVAYERYTDLPTQRLCSHKRKGVEGKETTCSGLRYARPIPTNGSSSKPWKPIPHLTAAPP